MFDLAVTKYLGTTHLTLKSRVSLAAFLLNDHPGVRWHNSHDDDARVNV